VNVSCGGDYEASYLEDALSRSAERASAAGILVVAAAGNVGHLPGHPVLPPASVPSVLTVGGLDDKNRLSFAGYEMYHSSYGPTIDGLQKPEVIAPGIWVATPTASQAELYERLAAAPDAALRAMLRAGAGVDSDLDAAAGLEPPLFRQLIELKMRGSKAT
jgi:serine protease AprX